MKLTERYRPEAWNPREPVEVTPREYEDQVRAWLSQATAPNRINWTSRKVISGHGGDYEIDVVGEMSLLGGAQVRILVECKRWRRRVGRDVVLAHAQKLRNTASHKGFIFSTSGFQRGALDVAVEEGIATLIFEAGNARYETRFVTLHHDPPDWLAVPPYAACLISTSGDSTISMSRVSSENIGTLAEWMRENMSELTQE